MIQLNVLLPPSLPHHMYMYTTAARHPGPRGSIIRLDLLRYSKWVIIVEGFVIDLIMQVNRNNAGPPGLPPDTRRSVVEVMNLPKPIRAAFPPPNQHS